MTDKQDRSKIMYWIQWVIAIGCIGTVVVLFFVDVKWSIVRWIGYCFLGCYALVIVLEWISTGNQASDRGKCPKCGYILRGSGGREAGCPECGWNRLEGEGKTDDKA